MGLESLSDAKLLTSVSSQLALGPGLKFLPGQYIIGIGIDVCKISRIQQDIENHPLFKRMTFTPSEIAYCEGAYVEDVVFQAFAARFAAKEAVIKALGGKEPGFSPLDINVLRKEEGQPFVLLSGATLRRAQRLGAESETVFIGLTHLSKEARSICVITNALPQHIAYC